MTDVTWTGDFADNEFLINIDKSIADKNPYVISLYLQPEEFGNLLDDMLEAWEEYCSEV